MKSFAIIVLLLFAASSAYALDAGNAPSAQQPVVMEKTGSGTIHLEAAVYPEFTNIVPMVVDPWCTPDNPKVFDYLKGKDIRTQSNSPNLKDYLEHGTMLNPKRVIGVEPWRHGGRMIDENALGVQKTDLVITLGKNAINPMHRDTAKILVTWTMRIEGECPSWHIGHFICGPFNGEVTIVCPAGNVATWLDAEYEWTDKNGKLNSGKGKLSPDVIMEIPAGTTGRVAQHDPTLTGTYVVTADNFPDKKIPDKLTLRVYWQNYTSQYITCPDGMRNMIVNVMPYTKPGK